MASLRITHMSSVHPPFDIRIFHKECRTLAAAGHHVSLVVTHDQDERRDGVDILAIPPASSRIRRMVLSPLHVMRRALKTKADVFHFHDPELIPVGLILRAMGKKVVYDVHEDVPLDLRQKDYLPTPVAIAASMTAKAVHKVADKAMSGIITVTPGVAAGFSEPVMVRNFPLLEEFTEPGPPMIDRPFAAVYIGAIGPTRGTKQMMATADRFVADDNPSTPDRHIALAGIIRDDPDLDARIAADGKTGSIRYHGILDRPGVKALLDGARVGLFLSPPDYLPLFAAYPNKVFEYMAAGIPVVASDFPVLREIVEQTKSGLLVDPTDPGAITEAVQWIFDNPAEAEAMGKRGREAVAEKYNFGAEADMLAGFYSKLVADDHA